MSDHRIFSEETFARRLRSYASAGAPRIERDHVSRAVAAGMTTHTRSRRVPWTRLLRTAYAQAAAVVALALAASLGFAIWIGGRDENVVPGATPTRTPAEAVSSRSHASTPLATQAPTPLPFATATPTRSPTPQPTEVAPGITAWTPYTSAIYGISLSYPSDWSVRAPATRNWQGEEPFPADELPSADTFVSPGEAEAQIGLIAWQMHIDVFEGTADLRRLAERFCSWEVRSSCKTFTENAVPLDFDNGSEGGCAILVPTSDLQFAFLSDQDSCVITEATSWITVLVVTREDEFPSAVRYGGSLELLKSIITTTKVWRPGQQPGA